MSRRRTWSLTVLMLVLAGPLPVLVALGILVAVAGTGSWGFLVPGAAWVAFSFLGTAFHRESLPGVPVRPAEEPELAALVSGVAEQLDFRAPLAIRLVPTVDASLVRTALRGTRAYALVLGWPLVAQLREDELTAVIAHELAHERHHEDRSTTWMLGARDRLVASRFKRWKLPHRWTEPLLALTQQTSYDLELASDRDAARCSSAAATARALTRTAWLLTAYEVTAGSWEQAMQERESWAEDLFEAVDEALRDPWVLGRVNALASEDATFSAGVLESHPSLAARLEALGPVTEQPVPPPILLREPALLGRRCAEQLGPPGAAPVRLRELDPDELRAARHQEMAALLEEATGSDDVRTALTRALQAVRDRTWEPLAEQLDPELSEAPPELQQRASREVVGGVLTGLLVRELRRSGWEHTSRWAYALLRDPDGAVVPVRDLVDDALETGDTALLTPLLNVTAGTP